MEAGDAHGVVAGRARAVVQAQNPEEEEILRAATEGVERSGLAWG